MQGMLLVYRKKIRAKIIFNKYTVPIKQFSSELKIKKKLVQGHHIFFAICVSSNLHKYKSCIIKAKKMVTSLSNIKFPKIQFYM